MKSAAPWFALFLCIAPPTVFAAHSPPSFVVEWGSSGTESGQLGFPRGIAVDVAGNVYVADESNDRVVKFSGSGIFLGQWGTTGTGDGEFTAPADVAVGPNGHVFVLEGGGNRVQEFEDNGAFIRRWDIPANPGLQADPRALGIDGNGNIFVSCGTSFSPNRIVKFTGLGVFVTEWGSAGSGDGQFNNPRGIAFDAANNVYVADSWNHRVQKFSNTGSFLGKWGSNGIQNGQFDFPEDVAISSTGVVCVVDVFRIQAFDTGGTHLVTWGSFGTGAEQFQGIVGIAIDNSNNVFVVDGQQPSVTKYGANGVTPTRTSSWGGLKVIYR
jgi:DNA-binding beta-propeller fold protein YncE